MKLSSCIRRAAGVAAGLLLLVGAASSMRAQGGVTISFGSFGSGAWPAGPDYATDVLGDPWDFCNEDDLAPNLDERVGWSNFTINSTARPCQAGGTTVPNNGNADTTISLLFRGFYDVLNPGRNGRTLPIDPARYRKLSYRMSDSGGGQRGRIFWFHYAWGDPANTTGDPNGGGVIFGDVNAQGYQTYVYDLAEKTDGGLAWTDGPVRGLRLSPNSGFTGQDVYYDWVRLTVPDNAPGAAMQSMSWSGGSGPATIRVTDGSGTALTIAAGVNGSSFSWNYGVLPPGTYTLRITRNGGVFGERTFTINEAPVIHVTEPNETGDEDFATTVLGNAWDMDAASDIRVAGSANFEPIPPVFSGGILTATNTNGDPAIRLLGHNDVDDQPRIDTSKYRFFTVRMMIEDPNDTREFGIGRVFWSNQNFLDGNTATSTKDLDIWPGWHTYTVDLASLTTNADGGLEPTGLGRTWTSSTMRHFRFDPSEFPDPRKFHIDYVKLAAIFEAVGGAFTIRWTSTSDPTATVTLYIDSDTNPSNGKTQIGSGIAMSTGQYAWNAAGTPAGDYWIYAEANDGIQTYGRYSTGQVRVTGAGTPTGAPAMSLDAPANGSTQTLPFALRGWAIDRDAVSGTGVDSVHVWATPAGGGSAAFVGQATLGGSRSDVASIFGSQFTNSGFTLNVTGLSPGTYTLTVYAHSSVTGTFNQSRTATVTIPASQPAMSIDSPAAGASVGSNFTVSGWAIDRGASSGVGVDSVHIWAFPGSGSAVFLGAVAPSGARPDVGGAFGSQFTNSGYSVQASGLAPGNYTIAVYARSTVSGSFNNSASRAVTVGGSVPNPAMSIDMPGDSSVVSPPFTIAGWAIDRGASSGTGVNRADVWAFPLGGGAAIFVGGASYGLSRPDVAGAFGSTQFTNSGFSLSVSGGTLPTGTYDVVIYAYSTVANAFNQSRVVRVTVN